jgi:MFS family permease
MDQLVRLDHLPFSRWHYMTVMALGVSWLFDGYEVSSLVVSSQVLKHALHMENKEYFFISSFYMIGCAIGGWLFAILSFFFGRKSIFTVRHI